MLLYPALMSLGAAVLASCAAEQAPPLPQASTVRPLPPPRPEASAPAPAVPRPARKPRAPPSEAAAPATGGEALATTEPGPSVGAPGPEASLPASPAASPLLQTSELIGLDQPAATRLFGPAAERSEEPPATVWRYKSATCQLDLFFYLDLRSGRMRTLHYAFKGDGADKARRQDCLRSLLVARGD